MSLLTMPQPAPQRYAEYTRGTLVSDGTEQTIVIDDAPAKVFELSGLVDLTEQVAGETITVREYERIKPAGGYVKYATRVYGVQSNPLLYVHTRPYRYGVKVTFQQTGGFVENYDFLWFKYQ